MKEEKLEEKRKENLLEEKIRNMRKERNKQRLAPTTTGQPALKKRKICKEKYKRVGQPGSIFSSWKREKRNIEEDEKEGNPAPEKRQKMTKVDPNLVE